MWFFNKGERMRLIYGVVLLVFLFVCKGNYLKYKNFVGIWNIINNFEICNICIFLFLEYVLFKEMWYKI